MAWRSWLAIGAAALLVEPGMARAQDDPAARFLPVPDTRGEDGVDEGVIIVTAVARPAGRLDSAVAVSVLRPDDLSAAAARSTAEVFRQLPGIHAEASGGEGNANISVRGLPLASGGAKFLLLQEDGLPVLQFGDIAFGNADIFLRYDFNVAEIQAVRGGLASTFASNAPGGVINFLSRDGSRSGGNARVSSGLNYGEVRLDLDYGGMLAEGWRFHAGGFWRRGEGVRDAGYPANRGYQVRANLTHEFAGGHVRFHFKRLDDKAAGYLPMPLGVSGTDDDPRYASLPGFAIRTGTPHSPLFTKDMGLDGRNRLRETGITQGMHPVLTALGMEALFETDGGVRIEERFRWTAVHGRFVSPFPAQIATAADLAASVGGMLAGDGGGYDLVLANGPAAGTPLPGSALVMRTHLFNVKIDDLGSYANDLKLSVPAGPLRLTAGLYKARQTIAMDWVWNSYLLEAKGRDAALIDVVDTAGNVLTRGGLYAYGVPYWGNCCQRSYRVHYDIDAPYLAASMDAGRFTLDASLRYDHVRVRGRYAATLQASGFDVDGSGTIEPVEGSVSLVDTSGFRPVRYATGYWSWSAGANYRLGRAAALFARASRGGRTNADRLLYGSIADDGSVRQAAAADMVRQFEAGVKVVSGPFELFVTAFHARTQERNYEATSQRTLDRTYRARGIELEGAFRRGGFDLRAGATWTDARIADDAITPQNRGNRPRRLARLTYQLAPSVELGLLRAGVGMVGRTRSYAQDNNGLVLPAFVQFNAFASVTLPGEVVLSIEGNNLFDALGITEMEEGAIPDDAVNVVRARTIPGRTVSLSLSRAF